MRTARHPASLSGSHPGAGGHGVARTLVESLLALLVVGALLGLAVGFALSRTVDFVLSIV